MSTNDIPIQSRFLRSLCNAGINLSEIEFKRLQHELMTNGVLIIDAPTYWDNMDSFRFQNEFLRNIEKRHEN